MRIGINLLYLIPRRNGGTETYALSLIRALGEIDSENQYVIFVNRESANIDFGCGKNFRKVVCSIRASVRVARYAWEQIVFPFTLLKMKLDVIHSLGYVAPFFTSCTAVVTIPDVNFVTLGALVPEYRRLPLALLSRRAARHSHRVITISHFSKREIVKHFRVIEDKVSVIYLGPGWAPRDDGDEFNCWDVVRQQYSITRPYITAFAGGNFPHKNLPRLFKAFAGVSRELDLLIIGELSADYKALAAQLDSRIRSLGFVEKAHLKALIAHGELSVFPSLYEGFGLPALEVQSAGSPLVCSDAGSLPEVAGDGALYFNPLSVDELRSAITECLDNCSLREVLVQRGVENLARFSWRKTACETLALYTQVVRG